MIRSTDGIQFHTSLSRLRKTVPLSRAGAVIRFILNLVPFDQDLIPMVLVHLGRCIVMVMDAVVCAPVNLSCDFLMIESAVGSAVDAAIATKPANTMITSVLIFIVSVFSGRIRSLQFFKVS